MYSVCVGVEGLYCVWVSKACQRLVGCVWVSKACRMCECRRLVGYVGVEGL